MESEWRLNVWKYGLEFVGRGLIATLRTPFLGAVAICALLRTPVGSTYGFVTPAIDFNTFGWQVAMPGNFTLLPFPYGWDVLPDHA